MDILTHFHLRDNPFRLTQEPEMFFPHRGHHALLTGIAYALMRGDGFLKLVGAVGSGKTMTAHLLAGMLAERFDVGYLGCAEGEDWTAFLHNLCLSLKILRPDDNAFEGGLALERYLVSAHAANRRTLLILDEAQNLDPKVLRRISLLSELEKDGRPLLQVLLIGQPELDQKLKHSGLRAIAQRVSFEFNTVPLSPSLVGAYILHRLRIVSRDRFRDNPMSRWAVQLIAKLSGGVPRLIHLLADKAFLAAFAYGDDEVRRRHVLAAAREMSGLQLDLPIFYRYDWGKAVLLLTLATAAFFSGIAAVWAFSGRLPNF